MLHDYLPRPALFEAYRALLTGPDDAWAMHYLGGGGVGKTMLMRALTSGTAEHMPPGFEVPQTVTARIDFDHINPDYPARRPGLLFAHLAEELRLKDDSLRASEGFGLLFSKIALLHERSGSETTPASDIEEMLEVFRWACEGVASSRDSRVVLLLDTCEELERLGPDGTLPDSVERTFDLLQRLHAKMPALRVVLCGRRPLAGTYAGGEVVTPGLPARPWLRLHRVFAFSEDEARTYLQRADVPEVLVPPVLARSAAAASSATMGLSAQDTAPRYSPFSLSVYATWIGKQRDVDPERILGDRVDHFVRIRILDRIHNEDVRRLLPHVALLGRFDDATLRACVDVRSDVADAVLREIGSQEWIDRQAGGYYAVEPELRARLLRFFEREEPGELREARRRVLPELWSRFDAGAVDQVPDEAVVQALVQMVQADREEMLRAWRILDTRVVRGAQATWGLRVLGRLLADDTSLASAAVDAGAWGAFVTTYAECVLHEQGAAATADLWRRAWDGAQSLEHPYERASVLVRVASGALTCACVAPDTEIVFDLWVLRLSNLLSDRHVPVTAPSHVAPAIAALMACADAADRQADPLAAAPPLLERMAATAAEVRHAPARALALACVARFAARRQDVDLARKRFHDALQTIGESNDRDVLPCLQWPPRFDAASWITLESLRGLAGLEPVEDTLARFAQIRPVRSEIATNRIASLQLRLTAAVRVPDVSGGSTGTGPVIGAGDIAAPDTYGQLVVPPRAVAIALDHVEGGRPAEGLRLLAELTSVATSARTTVVATAVERARIEAVTRMRLGEHGRLSRQLLAGAAVLPLAERERMRAFLNERPEHPESTAVLMDHAAARTVADAHAIWRTRQAFDGPARQELAAWGRHLLTTQQPDGEGEWARASAALDLVECSELGADVDLAQQGLTPVSPEDWWSRHPALAGVRTPPVDAQLGARRLAWGTDLAAGPSGRCTARGGDRHGGRRAAGAAPADAGASTPRAGADVVRGRARPVRNLAGDDAARDHAGACRRAAGQHRADGAAGRARAARRHGGRPRHRRDPVVVGDRARHAAAAGRRARADGVGALVAPRHLAAPLGGRERAARGALQLARAVACGTARLAVRRGWVTDRHGLHAHQHVGRPAESWAGDVALRWRRGASPLGVGRRARGGGPAARGVAVVAAVGDGCRRRAARGAAPWMVGVRAAALGIDRTAVHRRGAKPGGGRADARHRRTWRQRLGRAGPGRRGGQRRVCR